MFSVKISTFLTAFALACTVLAQESAASNEKAIRAWGKPAVNPPTPTVPWPVNVGSTAQASMIDGTRGGSDLINDLKSMSQADQKTYLGATNKLFSIQLAVLPSFADPAVIQVNGIYYAYATSGNGSNVQMATSNDFRDWKVERGWDALPTTGKWTLRKDPRVWAPDVYQNDAGEFVMTYSARPWWDYGHHCVGMAVAENPFGPFTPLPGVFACDTKQGGAIDSSGFRDPATNNLYVVYKVDGNTKGTGGMCNNMNAPIHSTPILLQRVSGDGVTPIGSPVQIFDRATQDGPLVEAPNLHYDAPSGRYVLFYSAGCYADPSYDVAYAFSAGKSVLGPYVRQKPASLPAQSGGTPSQRVLVNALDGMRSPGGASVIAGPSGKVGMLFHSYTDQYGRRSMYSGRLQVDATHQRVTIHV